MAKIIRGPWSPMEQMPLPLGATHPHHWEPPGYWTQFFKRREEDEAAFAKKYSSEPAAKPMIVFPPDLWKKAQEEQDEYERENGSPVPQVWPVGD